ncbi:MAG: formylglycine-generating enzyme family protein [Gammaproteobacteria bacterium]|nr:formylglycine-generating enzyme family protein [Gammaproteobacteria bacterium]
MLAAMVAIAAGVFPVPSLATPVTLPGGDFKTVIPLAEGTDSVQLPGFKMDRLPVTNGEFLEFVRANPEWQRSKAVRLFAGAGYLGHWADDLELGDKALPEQPVTRVSWFAATAYCESRGGRLPRWHEWEFAAAADEDRTDARDDPAWRQRILAWYAVPSNRALATVGQSEPNAWGIHDMTGLVWEWVEDYSALLVSSDNREQGGADKLQFCGAGAISMEQKENYAVLMRVAMLSSLEADYATRDLGFRCAYDMTGQPGTVLAGEEQ